MAKTTDFYRIIEEIKHIQRQGWLDIGIKGQVDSIASHSFGAAIIGWILAKKEGLDENRIIKMLLVHDLVMAYVDDFTPEDKEYENKRQRENHAIEKLFQDVPEEISDQFQALVKEYQEEKTEEAKLARESDKLETILQSKIYSEKLGRDETAQFLKTYRDKIKTKSAKQIISELTEMRTW